MAARRRPRDEGQLEFDLWGIPEKDADDRIDAARDAPVTATEQALVSGQLSFDLFADGDGDTEDEQVRPDRSGAARLYRCCADPTSGQARPRS